MKKYVFTLKDDQLHIAFISQFAGKTKIKATTTISENAVSKLIESYALSPVDKVEAPVNEFLVTTKKKARQTEFVLGLDAIISRTIDVPVLKKKELSSYLNNNISNFFTVDMNDYFYDFKIIQHTKSSEGDKLLQIKLVVVPKAIVIGIDKMVKNLGLKLGRISIYPDIMQHLTRKNEAYGILDTGDKRSILNIYDEGATFIYASFDNQETEDEFVDEVEYFTDFYASRHQGEPLKKLYVTGHFAEYGALIEILNNRLNSSVEKVDPTPLKRYGAREDIIKYPAVILSQLKVKEIRGEAIDFSEEEALKEKKDRSFQPWHLFVILLLGTIGWYVPYADYLDEQISYFTYQAPENTDLFNLEMEVQSLRAYKERLENMSGTLDEMASSKVDYRLWMDRIRSTVSQDVSLQSVDISSGEIDIQIVNIASSLEIIDIIIGFNETGWFEYIELEQIFLNDEQNTLELKLIPLSQEGGGGLE